MGAVARLFLAHFIADFPLQFDLIFKLKKKSFLGCLLHSLIHVLVIVGLFAGSWKDGSFWAYVVILVAVHSVQDRAKIKLWKRAEDDKITYFLLDQILHYAFIFAALLFKFSGDAQYWGTFLPPGWLIYYNDPQFINILSAIVLSGWGGCVLLFYLDKSIYKIEQEALNRFERSYGVMERIFVVIFVMQGGFFFLFIPFLFLLRLSGLKQQPLYRGILSLGFSSLVGFLTYMINLIIKV
ncbi:MAG: DUF3307 domain-containing protein [bacterium]